MKKLIILLVLVSFLFAGCVYTDQPYYNTANNVEDTPLTHTSIDNEISDEASDEIKNEALTEP